MLIKKLQFEKKSRTRKTKNVPRVSVGLLSKHQPNIYDSTNIAYDDLAAGSKQIFHEVPVSGVLRKTLGVA